MKYNFKSLFDRERTYTIETDEPLSIYDTFALSIKKVDNQCKSFSEDNIDCILKYSLRGKEGTYSIQLEPYNFESYYAFLEKYKSRNAVSMGEPLELDIKRQVEEDDDLSLETADTKTKELFNAFVNDTNVMNTLFKVFLRGVKYGRTNR